MLTYCLNCLRDLFFANRRRFAKIRSSQKFSRLQYTNRTPGFHVKAVVYWSETHLCHSRILTSCVR
ncbi:MAG: hypothetical protein PV344_06315, partial [Anaplasma sp.]|nr:hypothetical protein [Anaplasma sp.]